MLTWPLCSVTTIYYILYSSATNRKNHVNINAICDTQFGAR